MLAIIFVILTAVVANQTKPKSETFAPFITTRRKSKVASTSTASSSTRSGWFTRNILEPLVGPTVPDHTITDYYFFLLATLNDDSGQYLGIFHQWFVISELQELSEAGTSQVTSQAEDRKQKAVQAKINKDYHETARAYVDAAKLYEKSGSQFNFMEAAGAYEDAFKAYQMVKQTGPALQCLENAARLFRSNDRGASRAAKIYNQLGDLLKSQDPKKAAEMYREAAELFQSAGDGRALHATIRLAEQLCVLHNYAQAFSLYKETIIPETMSQEILRYTTRDHILNAIIAHLGATQGDWIVFETDIEHFEEACPDFGASQGLRVLKSLAKAEREHDATLFREACQGFDRLHSGGMPDWQVGLLLKEKQKLEGGSLL
ncbi:hypothetical protein BX616_001612 [Lobosporangium transversale]|uniref:Gamma-soluble NSF attachment protein n=1 Tax=Lobosporangium transversale TaxID=64571 RepID=A0A1Y2H062_9FUNG|nr:soluble NSF attachment protein [Lobosporangium transversale]KAF9917230.1 hypothetical protein BX616_001612 [Lobosporangium transversale]ORZ27391.1 soluble NSF attachment protein [Lobosporangium transversale]|eukprot:XP_021885118.1 soluble NSF attachment protein [Lobosporangium transversale]